MRTIILYYSKTGNTKKYAEDIANALQCEAMPIKKFKKKMIADYDTIVFGSRVRGGSIDKVDSLLAMYEDMRDKNVILFSVGMSFPSKEGREELIKSNLLDLYHVRYYQLRGSFDFNKLGFLDKFIMNNSLRMMARSPEHSATASMLSTVKERPIEYYDREGVDKIISIVRKVNTVIDAEVV